jgi:mycothiol S-conjugate amidase
VIITYNDDQEGYPHPDHLKVHEISGPAFERAGDPTWYPELGEPWQPLKLYYTVWSRRRLARRPRRAAPPPGLLALRREVVRPARPGRPHHDPDPRRRVPLGPDGVATGPRDAGRSQRAVLVRAVGRGAERTYPFEDWILARSLVGGPPDGTVEDDLFAGVRERVSS